MTEKELERRYKNWCKDAVKGRVPFDTSNGLPVTVCPLFRNVPATPLVLRMEQGNALPMPNLSSIIRDTAQRIDKNAASVAAGSQLRGEEMLALTVKELSAALAGLGPWRKMLLTLWDCTFCPSQSASGCTKSTHPKRRSRWQIRQKNYYATSCTKFAKTRDSVT